MKSKKGKIVLIFVLVAIVASVIIVGTIFIVKHYKKNELPNPEGKNLLQTIEDVDTFIDADKNFSIDLVSQSSVDKSAIKVVDQNGTASDFSIVKTADEAYSLRAPAGGWTEGHTYKLTLSDDRIKFNNESTYDKRSVTFTINRDDVLNVVQKDTVITLESSTPFETNLEGSVVSITPDIVAAKNIETNSIIIIPVINEYGFVVQTAYKVTGINGDKVSIEKPDYDEVFDELDIKGTFDAVLSNEYFHFYGEEEIEEQLLNSDTVKAFAARSESGGIPKVKFSLSIKGQAVVFKYTVTFPNFFESCDFVMEGSSTITLGAKADISILHGTFDLGATLSYKNEVKYLLVKKESLGENGGGINILKNATKKLQDMLNKNPKAKNFAVKIFETYIPTPIPVLGFSFEVNANFKLEAKIELGITFTDEFSLSVGVKKDCDGIKPYFNKTVRKDTTKIELCGSVEAKLGLSIKFSGSVCGLLKAGVEFEIGAYAKIAGFARAESIDKLTETGESNTTFIGGGVYFEVGIYSNLNVFAEVDLKVTKFDVKVGILEVKVPVLSVGNTQSFEIIPVTSTLVFNDDGKVYLPNVTVKTCDMFTGATETKTVKTSELFDEFIFQVDSKNANFKTDGQLYITNDNLEEFTFKCYLKLKAWQKFLPKFEISLGGNGAAISIKGSRGLIHYEVGALDAECTITVTKEPVAVERLLLSYKCVTDDKEYATLHPDLKGDELIYNVRDEIDGIGDYQIGRLVKIIPEFTPQDASYKQLVYTVDKGAQYILGGANGVQTFEEGGVTYALFRVVDNEEAVGNVNGTVDIEKEIKLSAKTTGYNGKYASWNKTDSTTSGIFASSVPTISFEITPIIEEQYVAQTAVQAGEVVQFSVNQTSVFPKNATRGFLASESMYIKSGCAKILNGNEVVVDESAEVGSQIIVASKLSGIEREYYLNIVKTNVESIEIIASGNSAKPGDNVDLSLNLAGKEGKIPTLNEVIYVVTSGSKYAQVAENFNTLNKAVLNVSEDAKVGSVIRIFAIADGHRSNTIEVNVEKIEVTSICLNSDIDDLVRKGKTIQLDATVFPLKATYKEVCYSIISGAQYAMIDSYSGKLVISNSCVGGEVIEVQGIADGISSNVLRFTVQNTSVQYVKFPNEYSTVRDGQVIKLDAFVNPDATNKNIMYSITDGGELARIEGDLLIISDGLTTFDEIIVRAIAEENSTIYAEKQFSIFSDNASLSINGEYDAVVMFTGESAVALVTDSDGDIVDNREVQFTITRAGQSTDLAKVDDDGKVTISTRVDASISSPQVLLKSNYNGTVNELYIDIIVCPDLVELVAENDNEIKSCELKPGEQIALNIITAKQENATEFDYIELETSGAVIAYIESVDEGYGLISYRIIAQVSSVALTGERCTVQVKYIVSGKEILTSNAFVIFVGKITEEVHILNVPETINIAESINLVAAGYPENSNYSTVFKFADTYSHNYATLNSGTGELKVNNNVNLAGKEVKIHACIDGVYSNTYTIQIVCEVKSITIGSGIGSVGVQFIPEYNFYFLYPNGKFVISSEVIGDSNNSEIHYVLDTVGQNYLSISENVITVKKTAINSGINATLAAYANNGVISNIIVIYIPMAISSVDEWFKIQDNITGFYVLTNDIDFSDKDYYTIPKFNGILDGCGHSLLNINFTQVNEKGCFGLFEENYGMIFNLNVGKFSVKLTESSVTVYGGAFCSKNFGYINNCKVVSPDQKFINILVSTAETYVGGICGYNNGTIKNSLSQIYINSLGCAAGIAGINTDDGNIENCFNRGYISAVDYDNKMVPGIVGLNFGVVENSINYSKALNK